MSVKEKMTAIADAIRDKTGKTEALGLDEMAEGVGEVYEAGQKSEYDRFWDAYQQGTYQNQFSGNGWNNATFRPKYDIKPTNGYMLFYSSQIEGDMVEILAQHGVKFDTSRTTTFQYMFQHSKFMRLGEIDFTYCANNNSSIFISTFQTSTLVTIDKVKVKEGLAFASTTFNASSLENITFAGVIGGTINFGRCPLSRDSITSIVNALSANSTGLTVTFSKTAKEAAFTADEWAALIAAKPNWTISLV